MFHLGSARTALFNWLIARSTEGKFILRIDDTDTARNTPEAVKIIYDAMKWLDLDYDITFHQSDRLDLYKSLVDGLLKVGTAQHDGAAVRLVAPLKDVFWEDTIAGKLSISDQDREHSNGLVLMRSDGMPTYHFASVVDDMDMGVTWIVRGKDHLSNTPKQISIWRALAELDWSAKDRDLPLFSHLGLITKEKKKISKRDGAASLLDYRDNGIVPEAMNNWLLRLGWGPTVDDKTTKTISRERALELFLKGGKMRSSNANMDPQMLESLNRKFKTRFH